jgi:hypothetical protein
MKILHVSASDRGGAGIAAVRLHGALLERGVSSKLLTLAKHETDIQEHYVYHSNQIFTDHIEIEDSQAESRAMMLSVLRYQSIVLRSTRWSKKLISFTCIGPVMGF